MNLSEEATAITRQPKVWGKQASFHTPSYKNRANNLGVSDPVQAIHLKELTADYQYNYFYYILANRPSSSDKYLKSLPIL